MSIDFNIEVIKMQTLIQSSLYPADWLRNMKGVFREPNTGKFNSIKNEPQENIEERKRMSLDPNIPIAIRNLIELFLKNEIIIENNDQVKLLYLCPSYMNPFLEELHSLGTVIVEINKEICSMLENSQSKLVSLTEAIIEVVSRYIWINTENVNLLQVVLIGVFIYYRYLITLTKEFNWGFFKYPSFISWCKLSARSEINYFFHCITGGAIGGYKYLSFIELINSIPRGSYYSEVKSYLLNLIQPHQKEKDIHFILSKKLDIKNLEDYKRVEAVFRDEGLDFPSLLIGATEDIIGYNSYTLSYRIYQFYYSKNSKIKTNNFVLKENWLKDYLKSEVKYGSFIREIKRKNSSYLSSVFRFRDKISENKKGSISILKKNISPLLSLSASFKSINFYSIVEEIISRISNFIKKDMNLRLNLEYNFLYTDATISNLKNNQLLVRCQPSKNLNDVLEIDMFEKIGRLLVKHIDVRKKDFIFLQERTLDFSEDSIKELNEEIYYEGSFIKDSIGKMFVLEDKDFEYPISVLLPKQSFSDLPYTYKSLCFPIGFSYLSSVDRIVNICKRDKDYLLHILSIIDN